MKRARALWARPRPRPAGSPPARFGPFWQSGGLVILGVLALGMTAFPAETLLVLGPVSRGLSLGWTAGLEVMRAVGDVGSAGSRLVRGVATLGRETEALQRQNQALEQKATLRDEQARELIRLRRLLQLKETAGTPTLAARVIGGDPSSLFGSLVLDVGGRDGIREGMAVLAPAGAVGRVISVGPDDAVALWLCDPRSRVTAIVQRSRALCVLVGTGQACQLRYLAAGDDVRVGDRVLTAGGGSAFPKGILVGVVKEVRRQGLLLTADVAPAVNVHHLEEVLVLTRGLAPEP